MHYTDLNTYLKNCFGKKIYKLSLNAGFSCPNRDGTIDTRGCSFCSAGGSGDFAASPALSITQQLESAKQRIAAKLPKNAPVGYLAYFQAFTNTHAPADILRTVFTEAINAPEVVALSVATRPDCLPPEVLSLLAELNEQKPVFVELGLQTIHENTAERIRRGYPLSTFVDAVNALHEIGIRTVVHLILGLPNETVADMVESTRFVCSLPIHGIKLQLLHLLRGTDLGEEYLHMDETERNSAFALLELPAYIDAVVRCVSVIPESVVIHRLTGDGAKKLLIAPGWSGNKKHVLNELHKALQSR